MNPYLQQKASPWVTLAVLAGGLVSACLLFFVYKVESSFQAANASYEVADFESVLEREGF